jgi:hypothetical protein
MAAWTFAPKERPAIRPSFGIPAQGWDARPAVTFPERATASPHGAPASGTSRPDRTRRNPPLQGRSAPPDVDGVPEAALPLVHPPDIGHPRSMVRHPPCSEPAAQPQSATFTGADASSPDADPRWPCSPPPRRTNAAKACSRTSSPPSGTEPTSRPDTRCWNFACAIGRTSSASPPRTRTPRHPIPPRPATRSRWTN